jgi:hypothetical protein
MSWESDCFLFCAICCWLLTYGVSLLADLAEYFAAPLAIRLHLPAQPWELKGATLLIEYYL